MKSDAIFDKIQVRLTKINEEERKLKAVFKFVVKVDGEVKKSWGKRDIGVWKVMVEETHVIRF